MLVLARISTENLSNKTYMTNKNKTRIAVSGGNGLIGTKLVNKLCQQRHEVAAASPSSGINTVTGEGLTSR